MENPKLETGKRKLVKLTGFPFPVFSFLFNFFVSCCVHFGVARTLVTSGCWRLARNACSSPGTKCSKARITMSIWCVPRLIPPHSVSV